MLLDRHGMPRAQAFKAGERVYVYGGLITKGIASGLFYPGSAQQFHIAHPWNKDDGNLPMVKTKIGVSKTEAKPHWVIYPADAVDEMLTEFKKTIAAVQEYKATVAKDTAKTDLFKKMYSGVPVPYDGTFVTTSMVKEIKDEVDEDAIKQIDAIISPKTTAQYLTSAGAGDIDVMSKLAVALGIATKDADTGEYVWINTATGPSKPCSDTYPLEA